MAKSTSKQSNQNQNQQQFGANGSSSQQRNTVVSHEQIERRAYELFLARGGHHGNDVEDWLQAEREVRIGRQ